MSYFTKFLWLFIIASSVSAGATNIVVVRYNGGFAMGADSLRVSGSGKPVSHVCKLRTQGSLVLGTAGSAGWEGSVPDLRQLSDQVLHSPGGDAQQRSDELARRIDSNKAFLKVLGTFVVPEALWLFVDPSGAFGGMVAVKNGKQTTDLARYTDFDLGAPASTLAELKRMQPHINRSRDGAIRAVRHLLQVGVTAEPAWVQPPFSILTVDTRGIAWVEHGVCP